MFATTPLAFPALMCLCPSTPLSISSGVTTAAIQDEAPARSVDDELLAERLQTYRTGWAKLAEKQIAGLEEIEALVDAALAGIDIAVLTPSQLARLSNAGLLNDPERQSEARAALERSRSANTIEGAIACHLLLKARPPVLPQGVAAEESAEVAEDSSGEVRALVRTLLEHPKLEAAFSVPEIGRPFSTLTAYVPPEVVTEFRTRLFDCARWIRPESSRELLGDLKSYFDLLRRVGRPEDETRIQEIRAGLAAVLRTEIEEDLRQAEDPQLVALRESFQRTLDYLESPLSRGTLLGTEAPELELLGSLNTDVEHWSELEGRVLVLEFWTTHCAPCVRTRPKLKALHEHFRDQPVEVIGVTSPQGFVPLRRGIIECEGDPQRELELMEEYAADADVDWPILLTKEDAYNVDYGAATLPHLAIVDRMGRFRALANPVTESLEDLITKIEGVLGEVKAATR